MGAMSRIKPILPETGAGIRFQSWFAAPVRTAALLALMTMPSACIHSHPDVSARYMDGPPRPEDIVQSVEGGPVFVSATSPADTEAGLYILDSRTGDRLGAVLDWVPERKTQAFAEDTCGLVSSERIAPHGIAIRRSSQAEQLLVVAHAPLEAILVYDILKDGNGTRLSENTCLALPEGVFANAVTAFGANGLAATKMFDPRNGDPFERFATGAPTGSILTWTAATGWTEYAGLSLSGPNGLLWDEENGALVVAEWARRRIVRISIDASGGKPGDTEPLSALSFMPDNLRWTNDGRVLVTGQTVSIEEGHACLTGQAPCPTGFEIVSVDPVRGVAERVASVPSPGSGMASVAAPVNDGIWVGSVSGNAIAEVIVSSKTTSGGEN